MLTGQSDIVWDRPEIPVTKLLFFYRVLHRDALYNWYANSHLSFFIVDIGCFLFAVGTVESID